MNVPTHRQPKRPLRKTSARAERTKRRAAQPSHTARSQRPFGRGPTASQSTTPLARYAPFAVIVLIVVAVVLLLSMLFSLTRCSEKEPVDTSTLYVCPYDWSGLASEGDRLTYPENGQLKSQVGVDVSDHQNAIDWQAVASDGIEFAFVRAGSRGYTEGRMIPDTRFDENLEGALAAGLDAGVYFFSQAINVDEALEEADFVLSQLNGRNLSLPVVYDHEPVPEPIGRANNMDTETLTACALAFCERIESAGYNTMIYGNAGDMARYDRSALGTRPIWFAEYDVAAPTAELTFAIWQYTNAGSVAGITTNVDLNIRFTDAL